MSETTNTPMNNDAAGSNTGASAQPNNPSAGANASKVELTKDHWDAFFASDRGRELTAAKQNLDKLTAEQQTAQENALKEQNKWQELATQKETEAKSVSEQLKSMRITHSVTLEAMKLGVVDPEAAVKLIDSAKLKLNEAGEVTNASEVLSELIAAKPYLAGKPAAPQSMGAAGNPGNAAANGKPTYKLSEFRQKLQDHEYYKANKVELEAAVKEGRVIQD